MSAEKVALLLGTRSKVAAGSTAEPGDWRKSFAEQHPSKAEELPGYLGRSTREARDLDRSKADFREKIKAPDKPVPQAAHVPSSPHTTPRPGASQAAAAKLEGAVASVPSAKKVTGAVTDNMADVHKAISGAGADSVAAAKDVVRKTDAVADQAKNLHLSGRRMMKGTALGAGVLAAGYGAKKLYDRSKAPSKVSMLLDLDVAKLAYNKDKATSDKLRAYAKENVGLEGDKRISGIAGAALMGGYGGGAGLALGGPIGGAAGALVGGTAGMLLGRHGAATRDSARGKRPEDRNLLERSQVGATNFQMKHGLMGDEYRDELKKHIMNRQKDANNR
jgi:hypothetical protein